MIASRFNCIDYAIAFTRVPLYCKALRIVFCRKEVFRVLSGMRVTADILSLCKPHPGGAYSIYEGVFTKSSNLSRRGNRRRLMVAPTSIEMEVGLEVGLEGAQSLPSVRKWVWLVLAGLCGRENVGGGVVGRGFSIGCVKLCMLAVTNGLAVPSVPYFGTKYCT